ncbi:Endoglucanase [Proteiniborus sp. DW1]|uniref:S-layer homology domain-containing protein n=1 Tax=Proteiniborus sp. DW1 TaxID=1889883 RepID=UPI00092E0985|nr:S-layer homology domain-containing protein [Proteiniborus sp. DW1]SCG83660.1 Endoglucanase [Proteiniborus sp. DW1]
MKKTISMILILVIVLSSFSAFSASFAKAPTFSETIESTLNRILNNSKDNIKALTEMLADLIKHTVSRFSDIKSTDWYINTVSKLVGLGGIDGYPDGTFKPNGSITRAEFTKILVSSLGFNNPTKTGNHWASGYITKAEEIKLIEKGELKNIDSAISRNEMAKMCANALDYLKESHVDNREDYKYQIKDFDKIPKEYQDYVLKAYTKGIISGYTDGTFKGNQGLTRAEASTVVIRVLDADERKTPEKPNNTKITELTDEDIKRLQSYPLNPMVYSNYAEALKLYTDFDKFYETKRESAENIYERQLWTPINYPPKELKGIEKNIKWFSSPKLIYYANGDYGIRGVVQKTENGKVYEADFEIMISNTTKGTRLADEGWGKELSGRLSEWKEVK